MKKSIEHFEKTIDRVAEKPRKALSNFPTLFLLLTTAGLVLVLSGFERAFDQIGILRDNPILMITIGLIILIFTGQLYKKLDR
tara:strand:- start:367 stop:615 length:249 start_codon:yes stop_codon:yes gene_type:complete